MLSYPELITLARSSRGERVLSVYLDTAASDPAQRRTWRLQLDHALRDLRTRLAAASHDERQEFERCVELLVQRLAGASASASAPGWVAFVTADGVRHTERLSVTTPTVVAWEKGIRIAPYVRALTEAKVGIVLLGDARKAAIYRLLEGRIEAVDTIHAHALIEPPIHMGDAPRVGFHPGTHGATGRDEAERARSRGTDEMLDEAVERVLRLAGPDGWIVVGGIPRVAQAAAARIARTAPTRVQLLDGLDVHSSNAQIAAAARAGASSLRHALEMRRIREAIENGSHSDTATLGTLATRFALDQSRVRELYFTRRCLDDHPDDAEHAVNAALEQGASVEEVSEEAARMLDEHGGMAAVLRYPRTPRESAMA